MKNVLIKVTIENKIALPDMFGQKQIYFTWQ